MSEFQTILSESEHILYNSLCRVVIRGKRGRGVPVLFTKKMIGYIEYLLSIRKNFDLANNNYLFGSPGTDNPIVGNAIMRKHAKLAFGDPNKASLLTSTKLRKHLATIVQILKMEKNDLEQLATFLGHTEKTHSQFYRLPDDIYQTAKVSKLLMLSKTKSIEKYKGQLINDIELDEELILDEHGATIENEELETLENEEIIDTENKVVGSVTRKKKCKTTIQRVRWTTEQKRKTVTYFRENINNKVAAKKEEVLEFVNKYPILFQNKTWQMIKAFVQNQYRK